MVWIPNPNCWPRYVEGLRAAVGSPDALKPPLPPLNRYKRDVALRLQSQDSGSNGASRPATLPHAKSAVLTAFFCTTCAAPCLPVLHSSSPPCLMGLGVGGCHVP